MLSLYLIILDTIVHKLLTFQVIRLISSIIDFVLECIFVWKENFKWFIKFVFKKKKKEYYSLFREETCIFLAMIESALNFFFSLLLT